jgi:hypothetical protein
MHFFHSLDCLGIGCWRWFILNQIVIYKANNNITLWILIVCSLSSSIWLICWNVFCHPRIYNLRNCFSTWNTYTTILAYLLPHPWPKLWVKHSVAYQHSERNWNCYFKHQHHILGVSW